MEQTGFDLSKAYRRLPPIGDSDVYEQDVDEPQMVQPETGRFAEQDQALREALHFARLLNAQLDRLDRLGTRVVSVISARQGEAGMASPRPRVSLCLQFDAVREARD